MLKLNEIQTQNLLAQAETGMGYQEVEVTHKNDDVQKGIVYNAELLFEGLETQTVLRLSSYRTAVSVAKSAGDDIKSIRVLSASETHRSLSESTVKKSGSGPAQTAPVERTKQGDLFKRFSAYDNDRRVTPDKGLLPGSYATTEADAKNVKTGKEAVARYALPNSAPASYVYTIRPTKETEIQYGSVQPDNNQPGGGVEVYFRRGTATNTVTLPPVKIPDE